MESCCECHFFSQENEVSQKTEVYIKTVWSINTGCLVKKGCLNKTCLTVILEALFFRSWTISSKQTSQLIIILLIIFHNILIHCLLFRWQVHEMEISRPLAERKLREHKGDIVAALVELTNWSIYLLYWKWKWQWEYMYLHVYILEMKVQM